MAKQTKKDEVISILMRYAFPSCTNAEEIDIGEYAACEKCNACKDRKRLAELGYPHFWK